MAEIAHICNYEAGRPGLHKNQGDKPTGKAGHLSGRKSKEAWTKPCRTSQ
ncbi:MAG: hypothetical protein ACOYJG_10380 [Prevotella sp.]